MFISTMRLSEMGNTARCPKHRAQLGEKVGEYKNPSNHLLECRTHAEQRGPSNA